MAEIKSFFYKLFDTVDYDIRLLYYHIKVFSRLALRGKGAYIGFPSLINNPAEVYLHPYSRLQGYHKIINGTGKFVLKEYSGASLNLLVVTGNHTPTVGIPQFLLAPSHINDVEKDVIVEEDVWIGANVTLLPGAHLGRGAIVGAMSLVNSDIPPYAVVVGTPAKIIGVKFSIPQILAHEEKLYAADKRFSVGYLNEIFEKYYVGKKVLGTDAPLTASQEVELDKTISLLKFEYQNR